jgi:hypothetical protein
MKIFMVGSKFAMDKFPPIQKQLEDMGHVIALPTGFADPFRELEVRKLTREEYVKFKDQKLREQGERVAANDAVLVMNFEKNGQPNYIGGAIFLEVFKAWELGKKIFFYNPLPEGIFNDELTGMNPLVINGDLNLISQGDPKYT